MRYKLTIILASLIAIFMAMQAYGNTPAASVKVYFPVGSSRFDPAYLQNGQSMDRFLDLLKEQNETNEIDSVVVRGYSSPEGTSVQNEQLSILRCQSIGDIIIKNAHVDPLKVRMIPEGVAWDHLRNIIEENQAVPSRETVLDIIDNVPVWVYDSKGALVDGRKKRLMELDHGETFQWLSDHIFPLMRNATAISIHSSRRNASMEHVPEQSSLSVTSRTSEISDEVDPSDPTEPQDPDDDQEQSDPLESPENLEPADSVPLLSEGPKERLFHIGVKTNMLYDAALVPNLGAEFYIGKNLSLYGEWMYAWWDYDPQHRYWRVYGGDLGIRWWIGRKAHAKPLTGHHLGIYGGILTFDFEAGGTGYMGGKPGGTLWDRWILNSGIEYGYSLPLAKQISIDFSIGIGYMGGNYIKYFPFDNDYYFDKEYSMHYFGPTKAEISLVWIIGIGNTNSRKGGDR